MSKSDWGFLLAILFWLWFLMSCAFSFVRVNFYQESSTGYTCFTKDIYPLDYVFYSRLFCPLNRKVPVTLP